MEFKRICVGEETVAAALVAGVIWGRRGDVAAGPSGQRGGRFCAGGERQREEWPGWAALANGLKSWRQAQFCFLFSFLFLNRFSGILFKQIQKHLNSKLFWIFVKCKLHI